MQLAPPLPLPTKGAEAISAPRFGVSGYDSGLGPEIVSLDEIFGDDFLSLTDKTSSESGSRGEGGYYGSHLDGDNDSLGDDDEDEEEDEIFADGVDGGKKRKRVRRVSSRNVSERQKVERRERNREHAKRSRVRKKFLLESLQQSVHALKDENTKLKSAIREHLAPHADELLATCSSETLGGIIATSQSEATKVLDDPDYSLVKALQTTQQNFVITDPSLPDNPIVYASQGFMTITGYTIEQVLGRNCRFLQGPKTDPCAVEKIRKGVETGEDTTVCLLNYRADGSTFWNQFFVAALRDGEGNTVNYLGVQCPVSEHYAKAFLKADVIVSEAEASGPGEKAEIVEKA